MITRSADWLARFGAANYPIWLTADRALLDLKLAIAANFFPRSLDLPKRSFTLSATGANVIGIDPLRKKFFYSPESIGIQQP